MADTVNSSKQGSGTPPKKELSMEIRLLLAFLLMGGVMLFTPNFLKTTKPPAAKGTQTKSAPASTPAPAAAPAPVAGQVKPAAPATPETISAAPLAPFIIDTDLYRIAFSNHGATVRSWILKKYKDKDGKPLELVNLAATVEYPFSLHFAGQKPAAAVNWAYFQQSPAPDGLGVTYEYSDGHVNVRKEFRFQKNSYLGQLSTEVTLDGKQLAHRVQWRGGFGDLTISNPASDARSLHFSLTDNKLVESAASSAKNGPVTAGGSFSFAGIADKYFAAVFLPEGSASLDHITFSDFVITPADRQKAVSLPGMAVGGDGANRYTLFVGPKDVSQLERINPKLVQLVDFGWFSLLAKPLFLLVNWTDVSYVHNFGWSIVVITIIISFLLFPLRISSMKSMRKMSALKPQIDKINSKYRDVGMRDPRKAEQNQEVMALYKRHGVNPMGGCLPMVIQLPFLYAFYKVFTVSVEMRGASWLWVTDLSQPEQLAIKILPIALVASQFLMQKMTPQSAMTDPSQQKMMMMMPLVFGFMFYNFPSGLVLYYLTSNLVSIGQQWFFDRTDVSHQLAASVEPPKKSGNRK